jgi:uncharacterized protein
MKILFFCVLFLLPQIAVSQNYDEVAGEWTGTISVAGQDLIINFIFSYSDNEVDGMIDIPQQNAFNLPVEFTKTIGDSLFFQFETGTGPAFFEGEWNRENSEVSGNFIQLGNSFPFLIRKRTNEIDINSGQDSNIIIPTRGGQAAGSLKLTESPSPLVILLTGSGSQDRDESIGGFKVFGTLSSQLYQAGHSSFRYDDRGVGQSEGNVDATLYDLADDLIDITGYLEENHGDLFTEIILLGHSQGGLVASIAALQREFSGIVFMGVPFLPGEEVINQQILKISEAQGIDETIVEENLAFQKRIYEVIKSGDGWNEIESDLAERLEEQINALPEQQRTALGDMTSFIQSQINRQLAGAKTDWFKSFIEYQPSEDISQIQIPILAVFGEKDSQVIMEPNREIAENLRDESELNMQIVTIPEANHLFQMANTGLPSEYGMLEREFAEGFMDTIVEWLRSL